MWKASYPRDLRPANALALIDNRLGRYDRAEAEAREALRRSPGHPFPLSNLALAYRSLGRYADARKVAEEAVTLGVETSPTRRLLYQLGVIEDDGSAEAHVAWAKGPAARVRPRVGPGGSRPRSRDAARGDRPLSPCGRHGARARPRGTASGHLARLAWLEALYRPPRTPRRSSARGDGGHGARSAVPSVPRFRAAAALAFAGRHAEALPFVTRREQRYPDSTFVRTVLAPVTAPPSRSGGSARTPRSRPCARRPTELGTVAGLVPLYLRAEAYLQRAPRPKRWPSSSA